MKKIMLFAASVASIAVVFMAYPRRDRLRTTATVKSDVAAVKQDTSRLFDEAAKKRFKLDHVAVAENLEPAAQEDVKVALTRETMLARLISEAVESRPDLVAMAEAAVERRQPKILHIKQVISGEAREEFFIAADTTACAEAYARPAPKTVLVGDLFAGFCVDQHFDYPGGFDAKKPLDMDIYPIDQRTKYEGVDNAYEKLVQVALRPIVMQDFASNYRATGKLSYAE